MLSDAKDVCLCLWWLKGDFLLFYSSGREREKERPLEHRVEHAERFDDAILARAPLAQLLESDKAVLVDIDFLSNCPIKKWRGKMVRRCQLAMRFLSTLLNLVRLAAYNEVYLPHTADGVHYTASWSYIDWQIPFHHQIVLHAPQKEHLTLYFFSLLSTWFPLTLMPCVTSLW